MHITSRRCPRPAAIAFALLTAVLIAVPAPAAAGSITTPESDIEQSVTVTNAIEALGISEEEAAFLERQEALNEVATQIMQSAKHDEADGSGLAGLVTVPEANELKVYWHGDVSEPVEQHIGEARNDGLTVSVAEAPYTQSELLDEIDRIAARPLFNGSSTGQRTMIAAPAHDGTSIEIQIGGLPSYVTADAAKDLVPALESDFPLSVTLGGVAEPAYRYIDFPQHSGGSFIVRGGTSCSSAFGVTGNNGAATYMLTAAHCGEGEWRTGSVRLSDGTIVQNTLGNTIPGRSLRVVPEARPCMGCS